MERKKKEKNSKPHIKKPLNAFMLYMKEQRAKVVSECTLKESAAINQILGRKVKLDENSKNIKLFLKTHQRVCYLPQNHFCRFLNIFDTRLKI